MSSISVIPSDRVKLPSNQLIGQQPPPLPTVGQLSAEAMKTEYETAATAIEELGVELLAIKARIDKEQDKILTAIDEVTALAKRYREEGKRMSSTVEDCAKQTQRVRDLCADLAIKP